MIGSKVDRPERACRRACLRWPQAARMSSHKHALAAPVAEEGAVGGAKRARLEGPQARCAEAERARASGH